MTALLKLVFSKHTVVPEDEKPLARERSMSATSSMHERQGRDSRSHAYTIADPLPKADAGPGSRSRPPSRHQRGCASKPGAEGAERAATGGSSGRAVPRTSRAYCPGGDNDAGIWRATAGRESATGGDHHAPAGACYPAASAADA